MEDFEVIQQAKDGDFSALEKWMDIYGPKIARFSFQCGSTLEQACEVAQETFRTFQNELETIYGSEQVLPALYKLAIEKLPSVQQVTPRQEGLFMFEEDAELHAELMKLDEKQRVPLILRLFHGFDIEQIATIIDNSKSVVEERIQAANELLEIKIGEGHLEKRLRLLGKSYDRLPVLFQAEHIIRKAAFSERKTGKRRKNLKGKMLVIASIFLIGILSVQFSLPKKENEQAASNPIMNELQERYKAERAMRQDELSLDDNRFSSLTFIKDADDRMNALKSIAHEDMEAEVEKIVSSVKLPEEMIDDIVANPLNQDEEASIAFLGLFHDRVNDVIAVYNQILWDHRYSIESFEVHPSAKKEEILLFTSNKFPEELQNIFNTMQSQSIKLCANNNTGLISACYADSNLGRLQGKLHYNTNGYINMLANETYSLDEKRMLLNNWEYVNYLSTLQNTLLTVPKDYKLYPALQSNFATLLYEIIKGSGFVQVFTNEEVVKKEFQQTWMSLVSDLDAKPITYIVLPIVEEMELSGWRNSTSRDQLSYQKIIESIELARNDELDEIMYGKRPEVKDHTVFLPDVEFSTRIVELYNNFKETYDKSIFKGLSPLYVVGVFDYANEMEDPKTMFYLFHDSVIEYYYGFEELTVDVYVANWRKGLSFFNNATRIEFNADEMRRYKKELYGVVWIPIDENRRNGVSIILDENAIWHMQDVYRRPLPSNEVQPETEMRNSREHVQFLYKNLIEGNENLLEGQRAIDIVALYFYAAELGDFETQYALLFQDERYPTIGIEEFLKKANAAGPQPKMKDMYKSISFKGMEQDENGNWPGVATLYVDLAKNPGEEREKSFQMMWTRDGWRVLFMPVD